MVALAHGAGTADRERDQVLVEFTTHTARFCTTSDTMMNTSIPSLSMDSPAVFRLCRPSQVGAKRSVRGVSDRATMRPGAVVD